MGRTKMTPAENKERNKIKSREWRAKNPERNRELLARHYERHKETAKIGMLRHRLKTAYGLSLEQYDEMRKAQNDVCAICKRSDSFGRRLCVDHDHDTDEVRGLLCTLCNSGLGYYRDDPALIARALEYLTFYKTRDKRESA